MNDPTVVVSRRAPHQRIAICLLWLLVSACGPSSAAALAPSASAVHRSCWVPDARATANSLGWSSSASAPGAQFSDGCSSSGPLVLRAPVGAAAGARVSWVYSAPADTTIGQTTVRLAHLADAGVPDAGGARWFIRVYGDEPINDHRNLLWDCSRYVHAQYNNPDCNGGGTLATWSILTDSRRLHVALECVGPAGTQCAIGGALFVSGLKAQLLDDRPPTGAMIGGSLLDGGPRSGPQSVTFRAVDRGLGARDARLLIGDVVVKDWTRISDHGGRCTPVLEDGPAPSEQWAWQTPCASDVPSALMTFDLAAVPHGTQLATLELRDVAGNTVAADARSIQVGLPPASDGTGPLPPAPAPQEPPQEPDVPAPTEPRGLRFAAPTSASVRVRRGRPLLIRGRLVDATGAAVAGAKVIVTGRLRARTVDAPSTTATATTAADGSFAVRATADGTRDYVIAHVSASGSLLATRTLAALVPAEVSFRPPRAVRRGERSRFRGLVRAAHLPPGGVRVRIEARYGGRWRLVAHVRSTARGRFSWAHRFRNPGPYRMRARIVAADDLPATPAASAPASFRVR